jgi:predicted secreted protein
MVNGLYSIFYIDIGEGFKPVACLTSNDFEESVETLNSTTRDNQGWATQVLTNQSYAINLSGIAKNTIFGGDDTKYSYDILKLIKRNRSLFDWKLTNVINGDIDTGKAQIISLNSSYEIDEFITFDLNMQGYGITNSTNETPIDDGLENILQSII